MIDGNGNEQAEVDLSIDPGAQIAIFVNEAALFQTFLNSVGNNFTGTMTISTLNGEVLAILGLLQKAGSGPIPSRTCDSLRPGRTAARVSVRRPTSAVAPS